jgi:signal transduction histidine kinase/FixJ family two-component response regulator
MPEAVVLVIDDEPGVIQLCQRLLERAGFHVLAISQSSAGLEMLEQEHVDLLLVDIRMPDVNGFQVIELARRRLPDLAVVVMTGFGTVETAIEALRRGADGLILKPFAGAELVQSVDRALQENQRKRDILRLQALRPLFDITETLFTETNLERLQELVLEAICGHLHCDHAGLYQRVAGETKAHLVAGRGKPLTDHTHNRENEILNRADSWSMPICVSQDDPGEPELQKILEEQRLGSMMVVPVSFKDSGSGVLWDGTLPGQAQPRNRSLFLAAREKEEMVFQQSDFEMFVILARQADTALENARLHTQLLMNLRQLEESQRALIQAEKLATAGRLTTSIAHEINNPLQAVQNCLHLAGRRALSEDQREYYLHMAQAEMERLMNTVQRMLDFYRPGAVDRKPEDMNELVKRVISLMERQFHERSIDLHIKFSRRAPQVLVVGDQIQQVFLNIILNAMEAMPGGGDLYLEVQTTRKEVEVIIEDTGPGISPGERQRIFEPFISTKEGGMGLGLAVSYGIISAHGGNLELAAGRGLGACFRVSLPRGEAT